MRMPPRLLLAALLGAAAPSSPLAAATHELPPLTIHQFEHEDLPDGSVRDAIRIPGPGYTAAPFSAAIATGDVVRVRIQAPPGKAFLLHAGASQLWFDLHWRTLEGGTAHNEPSVEALENRRGAVPTRTYSFATLGDSRHYISVIRQFTTPGTLSFTAFTVDITASVPLPTVLKDYSVLGSTAGRAIGAVGTPASPGAPILEIVDLATPVSRASWGGLKRRAR